MFWHIALFDGLYKIAGKLVAFFSFFFLPITLLWFCPSGFIPVCALGLSQIGRINLGQNVSSLRYFAICGLQEGFEPFAINMKRDITMWFSKSLPQFVPVPPDHQHVEVTIQ